MREYYKIGEISALYGISTDSLRYYEEIGILKPKRESNGYRTYRLQDIWKLNLIRDLRKLDFKMSTIKKFFKSRDLDSTIKLYNEEIKVLRSEIAHLSKVERDLKDLRNYLNTYASHVEFDEIEVKFILERKCMKAMESVSRDEEMDFILKKVQTQYENMLFTIGTSLSAGEISFSKIKAGNFSEYESVFFVLEGDKISSHNYVLKEGTYICVTYQGSYEKSMRMCNKLLSFAKIENYTIIGNMIELYHIDIHATGKVSEYVTELQFLVDKNVCL